jgi:hypothetical protein
MGKNAKSIEESVSRRGLMLFSLCSYWFFFG